MFIKKLGFFILLHESRLTELYILCVFFVLVNKDLHLNLAWCWLISLVFVLISLEILNNWINKPVYGIIFKTCSSREYTVGCSKSVSDRTSWCASCEPCRQVHIFFGEMNKNVLYHRCPLISGTITRLICSGLNIFRQTTLIPEESQTAWYWLFHIWMLILKIVCASVNKRTFERGCVFRIFLWYTVFQKVNSWNETMS